MADEVLQYTHPSDNLADLVTPTLTTGTADSEYPIVNLYDDNPAKPFKTTTTTFRIVWDWGSAKTVKLVAVIHANLDAALSGVKFEMTDDGDFSTPLFSQTLTVPAYHEDDFPSNIHADISATSPSYRYGSLAVTVANSVVCSIGEIVISQNLRSLGGNLHLGAQQDEDHPLIEHRTDLGVSTIYEYGTRIRTLRGDIVQTDANAASVRSWNRDARGRALPFVILPHGGDTTTEAWFVRFETSQLPKGLNWPNLKAFRLGFEEVSRGLKPTPSAV